jgi:hypothetical protein
MTYPQGVLIVIRALIHKKAQGVSDAAIRVVRLKPQIRALVTAESVNMIVFNIVYAGFKQSN